MLFDIKSDNVILEQPKRLILALNVMAIRDRCHANKSKQTTSLAGFDVAPPIGVASRSHDVTFFIGKYLHFSKTSLDEPLDVHLCSYFHEQHCVTRRDVIQT